MDILILLLALVPMVVTLLPMSRSHRWWVRMWDFPRIQVAVVQVAVLGLAFLLPQPLRWAAIGVTVPCLLLHLARIRPFTPLARREMRLAPPEEARAENGAEDGSEVTFLAANVLMENDRFDLVRDLALAVDPDVLLLMETDGRWLEALAPVLERYPLVLSDPRGDCYGMIFATRLRATDARIVHLTADDTPTVFADLLTRSGRAFHFVGLHPQPPVPGVDTDERDAQILYAARFAHRDAVPQVTMGDFNDAAWSDSAQLFKRYGRYLDPRVGRGLYASFHARNPLVRCAIDQLYVTEEVAMVSFGLGPDVGSDHFPVVARVRIDPALAHGLNVAPPRLSDMEREQIEARLEEYRGRLVQRPPVAAS